LQRLRRTRECRRSAVTKDAAGIDEGGGSDSRRNLDFWGQVGVGAVAVGIPCVIGGSASQGLLSFWEEQR
jgi:hypothetical protein